MQRRGQILHKRPCSADSAAPIHPGPSPPPALTIAVQSQAPKEAEIENTFPLKHSLNFMNSITLNFLSISWSEYCKRGEGRWGLHETAAPFRPSACAPRAQRRFQGGSDTGAVPKIKEISTEQLNTSVEGRKHYKFSNGTGSTSSAG